MLIFKNCLRDIGTVHFVEGLITCWIFSISNSQSGKFTINRQKNDKMVGDTMFNVETIKKILTRLGLKMDLRPLQIFVPICKFVHCR